MPFTFTRLQIPEVILIEPLVFRDQRGFFMETYKHSEFAQEGITGTFVQGNHSKSGRDVLRGLHYQKNPKAQGKLVRALSGEIYDVAVDLRRGGPTYGQWVAVTLSASDKKMLYVPAGFAHGFCVTSEESEVLYSATEEYAPECEAGVLWNDPQLGITWPVENPRLSARDRAWPLLRTADNNFSYTGAEHATPEGE
jgi:dTDP-4-dehydrorhamnose 3,5-epimerase